MTSQERIWQQKQWSSDDFLLEPDKVYFGRRRASSDKKKKQDCKKRLRLFRKSDQENEVPLLRRVGSQLPGVFTTCLGDRWRAVSEEERLNRELRKHIKMNMKKASASEDNVIKRLLKRTRPAPPKKVDWFANEPHGYSLNNFFSSEKGKNDEELCINYMREHTTYYDDSDEEESVYSFDFDNVYQGYGWR